MIDKQYFVEALYNNPTPYHYVSNARSKLLENGFTEITESTPFNEHHDKFFLTRDDRCICAVKMGDKRCGIILAAHDDFPCLKSKEKSSFSNGMWKTCVAPYGGVSLSTWVDRDLRIAGRALIKEGENEDSSQKLTEKLFSTPNKVAHIPSIGIRLAQRNSLSPTFNSESSFNPIISNSLDKIIANELKVDANQIVSTETFFVSQQKPSFVGPDESILCSQGLDNLTSSITTLDAFLAAESQYVTILAVFDNEEIGSLTRCGARSNFLENVLKRVAGPEDDSFPRRCMLISCDNNHGLHPNYPELTPVNALRLGDGPTISYDPILMFSSESKVISIIKDIAKVANLPLNIYSDKNSSRGGSTFGPFVSTQLGIPSIDIGIPILGMHSIRETCCFEDIQNIQKLLIEIVKNFGEYL